MIIGIVFICNLRKRRIVFFRRRLCFSSCPSFLLFFNLSGSLSSAAYLAPGVPLTLTTKPSAKDWGLEISNKDDAGGEKGTRRLGGPK